MKSQLDDIPQILKLDSCVSLTFDPDTALSKVNRKLPFIYIFKVVNIIKKLLSTCAYAPTSLLATLIGHACVRRREMELREAGRLMGAKPRMFIPP